MEHNHARKSLLLEYYGVLLKLLEVACKNDMSYLEFILLETLIMDCINHVLGRFLLLTFSSSFLKTN